MSRPLFCLIGFTAWTLLLMLAVLLTRGVLVVTGAKRADEFPSGVPHGGGAYWRLNRAQMNAVENLPIFAALVIAAELSHLRASDFTLACEVALAARVAQSTFHLSSGSARVVLLRFTAYFTQVASFVWMAVELLRRAFA